MIGNVEVLIRLACAAAPESLMGITHFRNKLNDIAPARQVKQIKLASEPQTSAP
ncbi:MAG: hypothetical protein K2W78_11450 [Xanthobacteraceae bacterium]|nr:hypothetical protein [Xanthobacteraceae bacterium]